MAVLILLWLAFSLVGPGCSSQAEPVVASPPALAAPSASPAAPVTDLASPAAAGAPSAAGGTAATSLPPTAPPPIATLDDLRAALARSLVRPLVDGLSGFAAEVTSPRIEALAANMGLAVPRIELRVTGPDAWTVTIASPPAGVDPIMYEGLCQTARPVVHALESAIQAYALLAFEDGLANAATGTVLTVATDAIVVRYPDRNPVATVTIVLAPDLSIRSYEVEDASAGRRHTLTPTWTRHGDRWLLAGIHAVFRDPGDPVFESRLAFSHRAVDSYMLIFVIEMTGSAGGIVGLQPLTIFLDHHRRLEPALPPGGGAGGLGDR